MTSGSILRGSLRPGGGRTPPFLIIGLLVICGVLGYNYWNLSAEYDTLVKEIGDLQDKFRIVALKREHAEKQSDAVERRFSETEAEMGKIRISMFHKDQELTKAGAKIERQSDELLKLRDQLAACQALNVQINSSKDKLEDLRKKLDESNTEKLQLQGEKQKLITERQDMRLKLEELTFKLAQFTQRTGSLHQPQREVPQVPGKNSVQDENTISGHLKAAEHKEFRRNENEQGYNNELLQTSNILEPIQHYDKNIQNDKLVVALHTQQTLESPLSNPAEETLGTASNSPSKSIVTENVEEPNAVKSDPNLPLSKQSNLMPDISTGNTNLSANGNAEKNEVKSSSNAQESKLGAVGNAQESKTNTDGGGNNLGTKYDNAKASDVTIHTKEEHMQADGHEEADQLQAEGPEVIHGHEVGDSLDDPNAMNQAETDGTIKKTKDVPNTKEGAFPKDTLKENGPISNEAEVQLVRKFGALGAPTTNTEDEPNDTHTTVTLKETDAVAIANPDVDYPLNKQSAPVVGQENLSGNGAGMGGGEEMPQSMHAIPHTKDNGDYVDSKNAVPGLPVPKPSDDEKEGEDNDIPADKMKDIKLPVQHGGIPRNNANIDDNHHHNMPANVAIVGKPEKHPGLFPPFRNEGNLRQEQMQS